MPNSRSINYAANKAHQKKAQDPKRGGGEEAQRPPRQKIDRSGNRGPLDPSPRRGATRNQSRQDAQAATKKNDQGWDDLGIPGVARNDRPRVDTAAGDDWVGTLFRLPAGLADLADRRLRRQPGPTFWLKQKDHDLLYVPKARFKDSMAWPFLSQALDCLLCGRFKFNEGQLDQLALRCRRRARLWRMAVMVDGRHFVKQSWERWLIKELSERGVRFVSSDAAAAGKANGVQTLWALAVEDAYYLGVERFQANQLPWRAQRVEERAGSLPLEIAGAMIELAFLQPGERLLDPVCGSGTLLAEAAATHPDLSLYGYDRDHAAVKQATSNLASVAAASVELSVLDSRQPRLAAGSVDAIVANLPFGLRFGDSATNQPLYEAFLTAWRPLLAANGRMVVLTADLMALNQAIANQKRLKVERRLKVRVKGLWAEMVLLRP
jgi:precorrin-6B methylase 2